MLEDVDTVVCATGYDMKCDFLWNSVLKGKDSGQCQWAGYRKYTLTMTCGLIRCAALS